METRTAQSAFARSPHESAGDGRPACDEPPLFVDLDGSLVKTDLLVECFMARVRKDPLVVLRCIGWVMRGRAYLKAKLSEGDPIDISTLPYHTGLLGFLKLESARGRRLVLATASDVSIANAVASHLGVFSSVLASDGTNNLKGHAKLEAIKASNVGRPFDYAGNDAADIPIWAEARKALLVEASDATRARVAQMHSAVSHFAERARAKGYWRVMRPHQWLKNGLVLVPVLTSVSFLEPSKWLSAILAFVAFCALSSSAYIINDLLDLQADRGHPDKRHRALASGHLSPLEGLALAFCLVALAAILVGMAPRTFQAVAATYLLLTLAYSLWIKSMVVADVVTLAMLYTVRIIAGVAAIGATLSFWLLAFSIFMFFSLALMKRCTELAMLRERGKVDPSRGYRVSDLGVLQSFGVASASVAVLIFALYINSPDVTARLGTPQLLWPACIVILYWLGRTWILSSRGEMHSDPLVFAWKDPTSIVAGILVVLSFAAAALVGM